VDLGLLEAEPGDDVVADRWRRGGGQGQHRRSAEALDDLPQGQEVRPEVVTPRGDAVRLVDRDQPRAQRPDLGQPVRVAELLRRDEQELRPAVPQLCQGLALLIGGLGRADPHRAGLRVGALVEGGDLVLLQGQQRRDHHCRPRQQDRRDLVDRRLAGAGGQDDQSVAAPQDGTHRLELAGAQGGPPEMVPGDAAQAVSVDRQFHGAAIVPGCGHRQTPT
jgi:hypothetical protein